MLVGVVLDVVRVVACAVEFVGLLAEVTDDYRRSHAVFMLVDGLPGGLDNGFVAPHRVGAPSVVPSGVVEGDVLLPTNVTESRKRVGLDARGEGMEKGCPGTPPLNSGYPATKF
jgi:hypothetical protein